MAREPSSQDPVMNAEQLYREEVYTDRRVGTIRRLVPVTPSGEQDANRDVIYSGQTQILTPAGSLPIGFEIKAQSLAEAVEKFSECAKEAIADTVREIEEMRRQAASSIVLPGAGGGMPGGGLPGGGIQMP